MTTAPPISDEVALRIALAAKVLPEISLKDLITGLQSHFEDEITEASLNKLTVSQLQKCLGMGSDDHLESLKEAVRILWGETGEADQTFEITPYDPQEWPHSIRIAVASNTGEELDGHFGSCHRYLIYQLAADKIALIDVRSTVEADLVPDKSRFRVDLIQDCALVYFVSIGGPAAAKVIQANIYPMKREQGGIAREVLAELQSAIATSPPPWLAKILAGHQPASAQ